MAPRVDGEAATVDGALATAPGVKVARRLLEVIELLVAASVLSRSRWP